MLTRSSDWISNQSLCWLKALTRREFDSCLLTNGVEYDVNQNILSVSDPLEIRSILKQNEMFSGNHIEVEFSINVNPFQSA